MSDALKAYNYLCEGVPKWLESIESIRKRIAERKNTVAQVAVPVLPTVNKSGSAETLADGENQPSTRPSQIPGGSTLAAPAADGPTSVSSEQHQQVVLLAKRKRKTASLLSGRMSGPSKYRSRGFVVYYDGEVQNSFETLVRNIGAGRNLLRKGKMAARIESLGDLGQESDEEDGDFVPVLSKIGYRPKVGILPTYRTTRARAGLGPLSDSPGPDPFDDADKALEKAQSMCERGAHQCLRDGDCETELNVCKEQLLEVLKLAEPEAAKYKAKDEQQRVRQQAREERERQKQKAEADLITQRDSPCIPDNHGLLEVDDEADEDEELTLAALAPIRMRSRLAARV